MRAQNNSLRDLSRRQAAAVLLTIAGAAVALRARFLSVPLERDEGEYAYFGQLILQRGIPYRDAYNMKPPGVYFAHAAVLWFLGENPVAVRAGATIAALVAVYWLYRLARRWYSRRASLAASATLAVLSASTSVLGFASKAEHFVLAFALPALWLVQPWERATSVLGACIAGILLGMSATMKPSGAAFALALVGAWWRAVSTPHLPAHLGRLAAFVLGCALPWFVVGAGFWWAGAAEKMWFWTITYARHYATDIPFAQGLVLAGTSLGRAIVSAPLVWLAATGGWLWIVRHDRADRRSALLWFLASSVVAVALGWRFSEHYFLLLLPAVALGVAKLADTVQWSWKWFWLVLVLLIGSAALFEQWRLYGRSPTEVARLVYGRNPFPEAVEIGRYLLEHSKPEDRVAVIGSEPEIYFYARRRAATGFVYTYPLMELHPFARAMQQQMQREIESARPRFLVLVHVPTSWSRRSESVVDILEWSARYANTHYRPVGLVEIPEVGESRYTWNEAALFRYPETDCFLSVFERKE